MWGNDRPFLPSPNHRLDLFYSPSLPLYFPSSLSSFSSIYYHHILNFTSHSSLPLGGRSITFAFSFASLVRSRDPVQACHCFPYSSGIFAPPSLKLPQFAPPTHITKTSSSTQRILSNTRKNGCRTSSVQGHVPFSEDGHACYSPRSLHLVSPSPSCSRLALWRHHVQASAAWPAMPRYGQGHGCSDC
jgi:hypothetical protein